MHITTTLLCLFIFFRSFCQTHTQTFTGFGLLGTKQIGSKVILLSYSERNEVKITSISSEGSTNWEKNIEVASLKGYNFNKVQLLGNDSLLFFIQQLPKATVITKLDATNGNTLKTYTLKLKTGENAKVWGLENNTIAMLTTQDGSLLKHTLTEKGELKVTKVLDMPTKYVADKYKVHFAQNAIAYSSTRVLEPNHGLMHLYLSKYDLVTGDTLEKELDLELAYTSFTYNSSVDNSVFGMMPGEDGFYMVGKLDIAFKNRYPSAKVGDNFIGFWVAKFNSELELQYFSEIPFQYLDHIVPADVIQKPTIIDAKEDANGGLFINLNEMQGVIYGKKYFVYLGSEGDIGAAKGGNDEYHFMEYDRMGLRDAGRKSKLRFINDDWTQYGTDPYLYLAAQEKLYSTYANNTINLAAKSSVYSLGEKSFTYFVIGEKTLYFEYLSKKKGTLNIYVD